MKKIVLIKEVYTQGYLVDAETNEEAKTIVKNGGGDIVENLFEYSRTLDEETWTVEDWING